jgi:hypothetical protein
MSIGCALIDGAAEVTSSAMIPAAHHRVRANRLTSILLRYLIAQGGPLYFKGKCRGGNLSIRKMLMP